MQGSRTGGTQLDGLEAEAGLLSQFAEVPLISKAWIRQASSDAACISVLYSQRNLAANAQRKYVVSHFVNGVSESLNTSGLPLELKDVIIYSPSPSGERTLVVRAEKEGTPVTLELWGRHGVERELQVPAKLHGSVFNDGWFASDAAWDAREQRIAYVAEVPAETEMPDFGQLGLGTASKGDGEKTTAAPKTWRGVGEWQEDWGELYTGKRPPAIFVLDLRSWQVQRLAGMPPETSVGQPAWSPAGEALVFVAWPHKSPTLPALPGRLGIVHCLNRACSLLSAPLPPTSSPDQVSQCKKLTPGLTSALCPRFSTTGRLLLFMSHEAAAKSGVHCATAALHTLVWPPQSGSASEESPREVLGAVRAPEVPEAFPGLYATALPERPFLRDGAAVLVNTQWGNRSVIARVDLESGAVHALSDVEEALGSWTLLDTDGSWVVASVSAPNMRPELAVARLPAKAGAGPVAWQPFGPAYEDDEAALEGPPFRAAAEQSNGGVPAALSSIECRTLQLGGAGGAPFDATLLLGRPGQRGPGILFLHGGPHSAYAAGFAHSLAFLAGLGYNLVVPNYRGSTGYGEASIQSLPGNIGANDVADCIAALDAAIKQGVIDEARVAVIGGSHGGFMTGNLVGQHPGRFRCGVLRNPVMDLGLMIHVSDIPDWVYIEAWGPQEGKERMAVKPSAEDMERFEVISPIAHVGKVTAPLLFMLGAKDRRVPLVDAQQYVRALKARGDAAPEARIWVFPEDTHALDKPQTDYEQWLNVAWWLKRHMK